MRVFISGAAGFIGGALAERLRTEGHEVAGVDLEAVPAHGIVAGDIAEPGRWQDAAAGAELVVHTAAIVSNAVGAAAQWRVNVLGTRRMLDAAREAGARRFVHFSSVRAFGDRDFPDGVEESWPVRPDGSPYVETKVASEQVALQAHGAGEIEVTVIRPGDVYGPRSRPWTVEPVKVIRAGRFVLPAGGRGIFSPVYIDNLVDGVLLAARSDRAAGRVYTISEGAGISCAEFFGHYSRMLGTRPLRTLPGPAALGFGHTLGALGRLTRRPTELNAETVGYLMRRGTYSIERARTELGYEPKVGLAEGMLRTESWLRAEGLL